MGDLAVTATPISLTGSASGASGKSKIVIACRVGGVLTDMTSVVLSDAAAAYGVKRNDIGSAVVADGTAMTHDGTGLYSHEFDDPAYDLEYTYSLEIVYDGETYWIDQIFNGSETASDYNTMSAAEMLEIADIAFQTRVGEPRVESLMKSAIIDGFKETWEWTGWDFRWLDHPIAMTTGEAYTVLPTDFRGYIVPLRSLYLSTDRDTRCVYVPWTRWHDAILRTDPDDSGTPGRFTIRRKDISGTEYWVVIWDRTPDEDGTWNGLTYRRGAPALDFASASPPFPDPNFDPLWKAAAFRMMAGCGLEFIGKNEKFVTYAEWTKQMAHAESEFAVLEIQALNVGSINVRRDADAAMGESSEGDDYLEEG